MTLLKLIVDTMIIFKYVLFKCVLLSLSVFHLQSLRELAISMSVQKV